MNGLDVLTYFVWLAAGVTFILALKFLASPKTARTGNLLGAAGMALVVGWTFFVRDGELGIPDTWWIIVVGAMLVAATAGGAVGIILALVAVILGTINVVGGFVVTDRMLEMFKKRPGERR